MTTPAQHGVASPTPRPQDPGLRVEVFTSPAREIRGGGDRTFAPTTSTLIIGHADAVLVDAQFIKQDIDALADMIDATGTKLTTIYITHGHADHYFGVAGLQARFPEASAVATRGVVDSITASLQADIAFSEQLFGDQFAPPTSLPAALDDDVLWLDGHQLKAVDVGQGDIAPTAVLHVPDIDAVIAGDVVYNDIHQMMAFGGPDEWQSWIHSVDLIESFQPRLLVAGHRKPEASNEDVAAILDGTRAYIRDFTAAVSTSQTPDQVIAVMRDKYPSRGNLTTLAYSAAAALDNRTH